MAYKPISPEEWERRKAATRERQAIKRRARMLTRGSTFELCDACQLKKAERLAARLEHRKIPVAEFCEPCFAARVKARSFVSKVAGLSALPFSIERYLTDPAYRQVCRLAPDLRFGMRCNAALRKLVQEARLEVKRRKKESMRDSARKRYKQHGLSSEEYRAKYSKEYHAKRRERDPKYAASCAQKLAALRSKLGKGEERNSRRRDRWTNDEEYRKKETIRARSRIRRWKARQELTKAMGDIADHLEQNQ